MSKEYFNSKASIWDKKTMEKDISGVEAVAELLDIKSGATVLDVGTGTGVFIPFLLKKIGDRGRLVCLDFADEMLKIARNKYSTRNIDYICADISDTSIKTQSFDAVVCYSCFPHFQNKRKSLAEINRILKNQGALYICHSSSRQAINCIHKNISTLAKDLIPETEEMVRLLTETDFKKIDVTDTAERYIISAIK